jgi:hypothetical protein
VSACDVARQQQCFHALRCECTSPPLIKQRARTLLLLLVLLLLPQQHHRRYKEHQHCQALQRQKEALGLNLKPTTTM